MRLMGASTLVIIADPWNRIAAVHTMKIKLKAHVARTRLVGIVLTTTETNIGARKVTATIASGSSFELFD